MSLLEIKELIESIETEFGVCADAPAAAAAAVSDEGPSEVRLILASAGPNKVSASKIVSEITGLGLMEGKG